MEPGTLLLRAVVARAFVPWWARTGVLVRRLKASCEYETNGGWAAGRKKKKTPPEKELNLMYYYCRRARVRERYYYYY
jgi:hypothetical protein